MEEADPGSRKHSKESFRNKSKESVGSADGVGSSGDNAYQSEELFRGMWGGLAEEGGINHARLIFTNRGKLEEFYSKEEKLGQGSFGKCFRCTLRVDGSVRALKTLPKHPKSLLKRFYQEIALMKLCDHPNIIKLYETFEDDCKIHLVMELCQGGDLLAQYTSQGSFSEQQVVQVMLQIFRPIHYLHTNFIAHRDIKPENFLLWSLDSVECNTLKLADFGMSCKFTPGQLLTTKLGTPRYSSPQVLAGQYDELCDLWSSGVIMYFLLSGEQPFLGRSDAEILKSVQRGNFAFHGDAWTVVSEDSKDMIRRLLRYQPLYRLSAEQALEHQVMKQLASPLNTGMVASMPKLVEQFRRFCSHNHLKRAALHVVAQQLGEKETRDMRSTFLALDSRDDGVLTKPELEEGLQHCLNNAAANGTADQGDLEQMMPVFEKLMQEITFSRSGAIGYTEFLAATLDSKWYSAEEVCKAAFNVFDRDGDGLISQGELDVVLGNGSSSESTEQHAKLLSLMKQVDANGDGAIDFQEFHAMMRDSLSTDL